MRGHDAGADQRALKEALADWQAEKRRRKNEEEVRDIECEFDILSPKCLLDEEYWESEVRWGVEGLMIDHQAMVVGGPLKTLKTSLLVALCLARATGELFLGRYIVTKPCTVAMFFGENTPGHVGRLAARIAAATDLDPVEAPVKWLFRMPRLDDPETLKKLGLFLCQRRVGLVVFDPIYLAFPQSAGFASNVFEMGRLLREVTDACLDSGATPLFSYHTTKHVEPGRPITLQDLAYAGLGFLE